MARVSIEHLVLLCAVAFVASAAILAVLLRTGLAWSLATDVPNDRSLHVRPTPRVGGWGIVPVVTLLVMFAMPSMRAAAACMLFLAAVSQIDDRRGLPARVRFGAHLLAVIALLVMYSGSLPLWALAIIGLLMVWLLNLYNFMDGSDGLAGGMTVIGFGGYTLAALIAPTHNTDLALTAAVTAAAALGFLLFNFHPARIFLGDAGSISLGLLAGAAGYVGWIQGAWPIWFPAMVFSVFIGDASVTLARRFLRGERFWQAHREHYYQRLVRSGMGHAATALSYYAAMATSVAAALLTLQLRGSVQWVIVGFWVLILAAAAFLIDKRWQRYLTMESGLQ